MNKHIVAVNCRHEIQDPWLTEKFIEPKNKLFAKCRGVIWGDRVESAIFHNDWTHMQRHVEGLKK